VLEAAAGVPAERLAAQAAKDLRADKRCHGGTRPNTARRFSPDGTRAAQPAAAIAVRGSGAPTMASWSNRQWAG
jgi:hypothetical protein